MESDEIHALARRIHDAAALRISLCVTGGGARAISSLLSVPGASRTVLEAAVPYAAEALERWLGARPEKYCSAPTARAMAMVAYQRARWLDPSAARSLGIAATASLASDRPKLGAHRVYVALQTADATTCVSLELEKGRRWREQEEDLVAGLILNLLAEASGISDQLDLPLAPSEAIQRTEKQAPQAWQKLLAKEVLAVRTAGGLPSEPVHEPPTIVFPGAFNPLHAGHRRMAEVAGALLGAATAFELSIENVDKPPLDYLEIDRRLAQFSADSKSNTPDEVWLTCAPTFVIKAGLFPGATFVVGVDTLLRIADARYYGGDPAAVDAAIGRIATHGCRFLVFGRVQDGAFRTLDELQLPAPLLALCQQVPEEDFRADISSTHLRRSASEGA